MIGPKPDSVNMYMHIIGIKFSKDETKELMILHDEEIFSIKADSNTATLVLPISVQAYVTGDKVEIISDLSKAARYVKLPEGEVVVPCIIVDSHNGVAIVYNGYKSARCGNPLYNNADRVTGNFTGIIETGNWYRTSN
jgi:hypothetical protein